MSEEFIFCASPFLGSILMKWKSTERDLSNLNKYITIGSWYGSSEYREEQRTRHTQKNISNNWTTTWSPSRICHCAGLGSVKCVDLFGLYYCIHACEFSLKQKQNHRLQIHLSSKLKIFFFHWVCVRFFYYSISCFPPEMKEGKERRHGKRGEYRWYCVLLLSHSAVINNEEYCVR